MRRVSFALLLLGLLAGPARAQPTPAAAPEADAADTDAPPDEPADATDRDDTGYLGGDTGTPELDNCEPPVGINQDQILAEASEHYDRGKTLYTQGDYEGAIIEFVAAYCDAPHYEMLWNIAQSYERMVQYEKAVAYLSRYIRELPRDQVAEREKMSFRVQVLSNLPAQIRVATVPPGATVTLTGASGVNALGVANDPEKKRIEVRKGTYEMRVELPGYEPVTETIEVEIGQPYSYYYRLEPKKGTLRVTASPSNARVFVDERLVAIGSYVDRLPIGDHTVTIEAGGRAPKSQKVEVSADQTANVRIELEQKPKSGRRELIVASTLAGGVYGSGAFLTLFENQNLLSGLGGLAGFGLGFAGGYFGVPRDIPVGHSSYIIGGGIITAGEGALLAALIACDNKPTENASGELEYQMRCPQKTVGSIALLAGIGGTLAASLTADRFNPDAGDSAVLNSGALWGTIGGGLFALAFDADSDSRLWAPLGLTGLTLGATAGVLLARRVEVSRGHIALIDLSGLAGMIAGVSLVDVIEPGSRSERLPHFALLGMTAGLITGTYITRNMDEPKSAPLQKVQPEIGAAVDVTGNRVMTFGFTSGF